MEYGEIFVGTFRTIWNHKNLWLFGILGLLLSSLGQIIGSALSASFMQPYFRFVERMMQNPEQFNPQDFSGIFGNLGSLLGVGCCALILLGLAGYVINLIMRGAIISEASLAWAGRQTDTSRGFRSGSSRALYVFGLDLLWYVPIIIVALVVFLGGSILYGTTISQVSGSNSSDPTAALVGLCALCCCWLLVGLAIWFALGVFAPLTYQSVVQGGNSLGNGISEGWNLARTHIGPMTVFWLLIIVLTIAAGIVMYLVQLPFSAALTGNWMSWVTRVMEEAQRGGTAIPSLPPVNTGLLVLSGAVQALISMVVYGFMQAFNLSMYAEVYRRLTGATPAGSEVLEAGAGPLGPSGTPGGAPAGGAMIYPRPETSRAPWEQPQPEPEPEPGVTAPEIGPSEPEVPPEPPEEPGPVA